MTRTLKARNRRRLRAGKSARPAIARRPRPGVPGRPSPARRPSRRARPPRPRSARRAGRETARASPHGHPRESGGPARSPGPRTSRRGPRGRGDAASRMMEPVEDDDVQVGERPCQWREPGFFRDPLVTRPKVLEDTHARDSPVPRRDRGRIGRFPRGSRRRREEADPRPIQEGASRRFATRPGTLAIVASSHESPTRRTPGPNAWKSRGRLRMASRPRRSSR